MKKQKYEANYTVRIELNVVAEFEATSQEAAEKKAKELIGAMDFSCKQTKASEEKVVIVDIDEIEQKIEVDFVNEQ